jgi:hypothetical protein
MAIGWTSTLEGLQVMSTVYATTMQAHTSWTLDRRSLVFIGWHAHLHSPNNFQKFDFGTNRRLIRFTFYVMLNVSLVLLLITVV